MLKRLILAALAAVTLVAPARADIDLPHAVPLLGMQIYVEQHCPHMQTDKVAMRRALVGYGVDFGHLDSKPSTEMMMAAAGLAQMLESRSPAEVCDLAWKGMGPDGKQPIHIFVAK